LTRFALLLAFALPAFGVIVPGAETEITRQVLEPPAFAQFDPAIASDGRGYLAVWADAAEESSAIHAARVAADGTRIDDRPLVIARMPEHDQTPQVAWDGTRWFVIWASVPNGVFGRFVETDGTMSEAFRITEPADATNHWKVPYLAFNGRLFLVVWEDIIGSRDVGGAIVDRGGRVTARIDFPTGRFLTTIRPAAANGQLYAITSQDDDLGYFRVGDDGSLSERTVVVPASALSDLHVASRADAALVAWIASPRSIRYFRITSEGVGAMHTFEGGALALEDVIAEANDFLIVYVDDGNRMVRRTSIAASIPLDAPRVRAGAHGMLIVSLPPPRSPFVAPFGDDLYLRPLDEPDYEPLAVAVRHQTGVDIAASGALRLAAWTELLDSGQHLGIVAARIDARGHVLDRGGIDLDLDLRDPGLPLLRVAGGPEQWLIVWREGLIIRGVRVAHDGRVLDKTPIAIAREITYPDAISVAWDGRYYQVVFTRGDTSPGGGTWAVHGVRVWSDGAVEGEMTLSARGPNAAPAVASGPAGSLIVWTNRDLFSAGSPVRGSLLSPEGTATPIQFPTRDRTSTPGAAVAWNGDRFLVASDSGEALEFFFVSATGVITYAPATIALAQRQTTLELEPHGDGFLLAYGDDDAVHVAKINRDGYFDEPPVAVAPLGLDETRIGLSGSMLAYARGFDPFRNRISRAVVQEISVTPEPPKRRSVR
jgi:hypothetical protein